MSYIQCFPRQKWPLVLSGWPGQILQSYTLSVEKKKNTKPGIHEERYRDEVNTVTEFSEHAGTMSTRCSCQFFQHIKVLERV